MAVQPSRELTTLRCGEECLMVDPGLHLTIISFIIIIISSFTTTE